jgi:hypothetical protein
MVARLIRPASATREGVFAGLTGTRGSFKRRLGAVALFAAVLAGHLGLTARLSETMPGWGNASEAPARLRAVFTRELKAAAPARVVQASPARARSTLAALPPEPAGSQPRHKPRHRVSEPPRREPSAPAPSAEALAKAEDVMAPELTAAAASTPDRPFAQTEAAVPAASEFASAPPPTAGESAPASPTGAATTAGAPASAPQAAPMVGAQPVAAAASAAAFEWPASTQLKYRLTGWYRGELHGSAKVEWIREGARYQVHLDVVIGLPFAPMMTRRITSDGELTEQGLRPRRYDEETRVGFAEPRLLTIRFEPDRVVLPGGRTVAGWPAVQDSASQFVQLTWLFTLQPQLLQPGGTVAMALALPRYVDRWVFDVLGEETLYAPFGQVQAVHLKPRRDARPGIDRTAEIWIAPQLLYLPVRIRIWNDEQTHIDLMIERPPLQAVMTSEPR